MRKAVVWTLGLAGVMAMLFLFYPGLIPGIEKSTGQELPFEFKPAIRWGDQVYWLCPQGHVPTIPHTSEVVGKIELIAPATRPPAQSGEAIGFSQEFLGAGILQCEDAPETIYVYHAEIQQYIPFVVAD